MNNLNSKKLIIVALWTLVSGFLVWADKMAVDLFIAATAPLITAYLGFELTDKKTRNGGM